MFVGWWDSSIDGEIVCLDARGRSNFKSLLFRRDRPFLYAFDLLEVDGEDLRELPLIERKRRLRQLIPSVPTRLLYIDHVSATGKDFSKSPARTDLEEIVAKPANGRYHSDGSGPNWVKIKNPAYTQMTARYELFERPTGSRKRRPMAARRVSAVGGRSLNATFAPSTCPSSRQPP